MRRDQQLRALFVTDFPRRNGDQKENALSALREKGFTVTEEKGLWLLDLGEEARCGFIASLPAPAISADLPLPVAALCRSLLFGGATPPSQQPWEAVKRTLLRLDAGEMHLLIPELRLLCARYKRQKTPLPTCIVSLLDCKEDMPC
ncbi:MAG: hypothetical protein IKW00_01090 [Clostridia bacterium]|nr:hypothetical protein [Clostridia bacterium]